MSKDNGGPAFPVIDVMALDPSATVEMIALTNGMTLRDYFAAKASDADVERIMLESYDPVLECYQVSRQQARYMHADAMLLERAK